MKLLGILLFISSFFYAGAKHCNNFNFPVVTPRHDTPVTWIDDFKSFRTAISQNDKAAVKKYFKFPVYNEANEIWILVLPEASLDSAYQSITTPVRKKLAFREKDLDKYYAKLFPSSFKKSILKVKTDLLFKSGTVETFEMKEGKTTYKMYVTYDKKLHTLSLNLSYNTVLKDENGEIQDGGESNVIYNFIIDKTGHIFFNEVRLAG